MGIHTWFKNRIDLTFEKAQQRAIKEVKDSIGAYKRLLKQIETESNPRKKDYLQSICTPNFEEKAGKTLQLIKDGDHYHICLNLYSIDDGYSYSGYGFGILVDTEFDDTFRLSYDDFGDRKEFYEGYEFHSLEETITFLDRLDPSVKENDYKFPCGYMEKIKAFWEKYPNGQIYFR
jgi:hypothetical protein